MLRQPGRYELRESMARGYDPYFSHLTRSEHEEARERLEGIWKRTRDMTAPRPCVAAPAAAHAFFGGVRRVLLCPRMAAVWRASLSGAVETAAGSTVTDGIIDAIFPSTSTSMSASGHPGQYHVQGASAAGS